MAQSGSNGNRRVDQMQTLFSRLTLQEGILARPTFILGKATKKRETRARAREQLSLHWGRRSHWLQKQGQGHGGTPCTLSGATHEGHVCELGVVTLLYIVAGDEVFSVFVVVSTSARVQLQLLSTVAVQQLPPGVVALQSLPEVVLNVVVMAAVTDVVCVVVTLLASAACSVFCVLISCTQRCDRSLNLLFKY